MRRFVDLMHRKWSGLHESALLLATTSLISQVLGFIFYRIVAAKFGTGAELDVFYAAFRIPDFLYATVASFVAVTVLIPFISEIAEKEGRKEDERLRDLISTVFTVFALMMTIVCGVAWIFMPMLADLLVPGFPQIERTHYIEVARVLLLSPFLLGLSNLFGSVTQSLQRFFVFAVGPILYNIGMFVGILVLYQPFGTKGIAWGVVLGALMHMGIQLPVLARNGLIPRLTLAMKSVIPRIATLSILRTASLSASSIAMIILTGLASKTNGAITVFTFANSLQGITNTIIGMSYSVAAFPTLSAIWARGDKTGFRGQLLNAARHIVFWAFPITILSIVLRAQIVRVLFGAGRFDWSATKLVAAALALFVVSAAAQSLVLLFTRGLYAVGETTRALVANVTGAIVIVIAAYGLDTWFAQNDSLRYFLETILRVDGVTGTRMLVLPLAYSVGMIVTFVMLIIALEKKTPHLWRGLRRSFYQSFSISILMGFVAYHVLAILAPEFDQNTFIGIASQGLLSGVAAIVTGLFLFSIFENREYLEIRSAMRSRLARKKINLKAKPIAVETEHI